MSSKYKIYNFKKFHSIPQSQKKKTLLLSWQFTSCIQQVETQSPHNEALTQRKISHSVLRNYARMCKTNQDF